MLDQLFDFIVGFGIICIPMALGALAAGIIETIRTIRERRGR